MFTRPDGEVAAAQRPGASEIDPCRLVVRLDRELRFERTNAIHHGLLIAPEAAPVEISDRRIGRRRLQKRAGRNENGSEERNRPPWEIRQGVSAGNGGTLIASGTTLTPQVTATGRSGFGFIEFMVQVNDLDVHLDPGTYWLNVTPVDNLDGGRSFDSTTSGGNCIGTPCGDNDTAFLDSTLFGAFFEPVIDFGAFSDFSMGVNGEVSGGGGFTQTAAASRKTHGNAGPFDISLPGVECRQGNGGTFLQTIVFTFSEDVTSISGASTTTCGRVESTTFSVNTVTV